MRLTRRLAFLHTGIVLLLMLTSGLLSVFDAVGMSLVATLLLTGAACILATHYVLREGPRPGRLVTRGLWAGFIAGPSVLIGLAIVAAIGYRSGEGFWLIFSYGLLPAMGLGTLAGGALGALDAALLRRYDADQRAENPTQL